jgi:hypothetical protein
MARGWESKSVESQMESARDEKRVPSRQPSSKEKEVERERQNLLLSRTHVRQQMKSAINQKYAGSLRNALDEIERRLAKLDGKS